MIARIMKQAYRQTIGEVVDTLITKTVEGAETRYAMWDLRHDLKNTCLEIVKLLSVLYHGQTPSKYENTNEQDLRSDLEVQGLWPKNASYLLGCENSVQLVQSTYAYELFIVHIYFTYYCIGGWQPKITPVRGHTSQDITF